MQLDLLNKLFLELSHVCSAKTGAEMGLENQIVELRKVNTGLKTMYTELTAVHQDLKQKHETVSALLSSERAKVRDLRCR